MVLGYYDLIYGLYLGILWIGCMYFCLKFFVGKFSWSNWRVVKKEVVEEVESCLKISLSMWW